MYVHEYLRCVGCSEYTIIPARYAYLLSSDITDSQAAVLERKNYMLQYYIRQLEIFEDDNFQGYVASKINFLKSHYSNDNVINPQNLIHKINCGEMTLNIIYLENYPLYGIICTSA